MKLSAWFFLWVLPLASLDPDQGSFSTLLGAKGVVLRRSQRNTKNSITYTTKDPEPDQNQCPPGYYKKSNQATRQLECSPCLNGTFAAIPNTLKKCFRCKMCDEEASQVTQAVCTQTSDTVCSCKEGYGAKQHSSSQVLHCQKVEITPTTKIRPNATTEGPNPTITQYAHSQVSFLPVLLAFMAVLVLGVVITPVLCFRTRFSGSACHCCLGLHSKHTKPIYTTIIQTQEHPNSPTPAEMSCDRRSDPVLVVTSSSVISQQPEVQKVSEVLTIPNRPLCTDSRLLSTDDIKPACLKMLKQESQNERFPPPVLYAIIREVPVRRWKEFLRLLHVPDSQIERVELEAGPSYLEQQYQMLRLWSHRGGAELADIYAALGSMELTGCGQELRDKLGQMEQVQPCVQTLPTESSDHLASG
ncbi:tumor necrosis factor receptor superfamily member 25-like [Arapaima gigas]